MPSLTIAQRLAAGAAAGIAGTAVIMALHAANEKLAPDAMEPLREEPGNFITWQAERLLPAHSRHRVPQTLESASAMGLSVGYGAAFGALYGLLRKRGRRAPASIAVDGTLLGLACWAVGYVGWLPAVGLMRPIHKQRPVQVFSPILQHIAYGLAAAAAFSRISRHFQPHRHASSRVARQLA
jgi:hypothetical protein